MDFDVRHYTGFLVIASGVVIVAMSYLAAYMVGKNAGRKEAERRDALPPGHEPNRLDRIESAVDAIALQVERLGEGQRYLLGTRDAVRQSQPAPPPERRHTTPV
jgi:hypothetical protein